MSEAKGMDINMNEELLFKTYGLLFLGFAWGITSIYEAIRIQRQKGVVTESRVVFVTMLILSFLQILMMDRLDIDLFIWFGIFGSIILISLWVRVYFGGKNVKIYETTRERIIPILENTLKDMSIPYEEKDGLNSEETVFHLIEDKTKISVEGGIFGEEEKDYTISLKKTWRSYRMEELQLRLIESYRDQKEEKIYWKQILINVVLGIAFILGTSFTVWNLFYKVT
ncbi:hypothetical protein AWH56_013935 [Anaerobacillus isosaccharinicus]|uniref:Uncharacterized protein n=2 Tax=Anaerobacillus isosaccharinicus TaxID=1532552 RepID=A0A7S7L3R4_9BACI|nr:hypothetical protein [Anaerobacillus isosaccharinicus]MBA5588003.1 hypothetical protein [Anaerobacillus isosaccharinicus]QOY33851.1 hypothetical protein AWH56_013935 [Anaerobacillus isosaccharinicus]